MPTSGLLASLGSAADLVWPACCAGCGRPGTPCCPPCGRSLRVGATATVAGNVPVRACAAHTGPARQLLLAVKERGRAELRPRLSGALAHALERFPGEVAEGFARALSPGPLVLVPVPTRWASRRARGDDLVADLAARTAAVARRRGHDVRVARVLRLRRRVREQTDLDAAGRRLNLHGAFALHGPAPRHRCVVLDDVVTTGATAGEAVRALRAGGARVNGVLTVTVA